ncbi:MAG: type II secretion system protein [Bacilli bacterium]|nr:type II secretion system protein [Bacilli bacterium]MDD4808586.1 type II secretion system protein [Bacilli bacterium]
MKSNKGFTLIELLAVIVILAVIALIAAPIIVGLIDDARKSSAANSAYGVYHAAENVHAKVLIKSKKGVPANVVYTFNTTGVVPSYGGSGTIPATWAPLTEADLKINFKGTIPTSGSLTLTPKGDVIATGDLKINNFICKYTAVHEYTCS